MTAPEFEELAVLSPIQLFNTRLLETPIVWNGDVKSVVQFPFDAEDQFDDIVDDSFILPTHLVADNSFFQFYLEYEY